MRKTAFLVLLVFCAAAVRPSLALETVASPSARAGSAFDHGMAAVKEAKWDIAEKYFMEAWADAPSDPAVLLNLGIANAQMGRAVPASLWFRTYLAADPAAKNAQQVKEEIARLEVQAREISGKLIKQAVASVELLPEEADMVKARAFAEIAFSMAGTGEVENAIKLSRRYSYFTAPASSYWCYFGQYQLTAGDFEGALETLAKITETRDRDRLLYWLSIEYVRWGKYREARDSLQEISDPMFKTSAIERLLLPYTATLQTDKAAELAKELAGPGMRSTVLSMLINGYLLSGDTAKAEGTAREMKSLKGPGGAYELRDEALMLAVTGKPDDAYGKISRAVKKLNKEENNSPRERVKVETAIYFVTIALTWKGETQWAEKICRLADKSPLAEGPGVRAALSVIAAEKGDLRAAFRDVETLPADEKGRMCGLLVWRLLAKGRFSEAAQIASEWPSRRGKGKGFVAIAEYFWRLQEFTRWAYFLRMGFIEAAASNSMDTLNKIVWNVKKCGNSAVVEAVLSRARVTSWTSLALYYESQPPLKDLTAYLEETKSGHPELAAFRLAQAGEAWGSALVNIRATEKRIAEGGL